MFLEAVFLGLFLSFYTMQLEPPKIVICRKYPYANSPCIRFW